MEAAKAPRFLDICYTPDWCDRIGLSKSLSPIRLDQIGLANSRERYLIDTPNSTPSDLGFSQITHCEGGVASIRIQIRLGTIRN